MLPLSVLLLVVLMINFIFFKGTFLSAVTKTNQASLSYLLSKLYFSPHLTLFHKKVSLNKAACVINFLWQSGRKKGVLLLTEHVKWGKKRCKKQEHFFIFCFHTIKMCWLKSMRFFSMLNITTHIRFFKLRIIQQSNVDIGWLLQLIQCAPGVLHLVAHVHFKG